MGADDSSALVYAGVIPTDVSRIAFIGSAWGSAVSLDAAQAADAGVLSLINSPIAIVVHTIAELVWHRPASTTRVEN